MADHDLESSVGASVDALIATANAWLAAEPDDDIRAELSELIDAAERGEADELAARFDGRLQFGTAGLRAAVAAGSMRMNRLVVRQAAAGLGRWLLDAEASGDIADAAKRGVVIAHDARRKSDAFADDTARVLAAMGIRSMLHPGVQPTPVLAWSITGMDAAAGVVVTASHNPPADNGYKVYLDTGSQIVSPIDTDIADRIAQFDPLAVELAPADDPLIERLDDSWADRYVEFVPSVRLRPDVAGVSVAYTAMHGVGGATVLRAFEAAGLPAPHVVAAQQEPDGTFPTVSFPNPEEPGAMDLLLAEAQACDAKVALGERSRRRPPRRGDPATRRLVAAVERRRDRLAVRRLHPREHLRRRPAGRDHAGVVVVARPDGRGRRRAQRGDVHRLQVDRQDRHRTTRPAIDARVRTGARLPGGAAPARQGRHHRCGADGRDRCGRRLGGPDAAGPARLDRRPVRAIRHRRAVGEDAARRRRSLGRSRSKPTRRPRSMVGRSSRCRRTPRPTWFA